MTTETTYENQSNAREMTLTDFLRDRFIEELADLDCGLIAHDGGQLDDAGTPITPANCPCDFRAKREVRAKIRLVATYEGAQQARSHATGAVAEALGDMAVASLDDVVRILATIYTDHPNYREEWKP